MKKIPTIETQRLRLRPFNPADAPDVQRLASERDVAVNTVDVPHPYEDGVAEEWIGSHQEKFERGEEVNFAIVHPEQGFLIGFISLIINPKSESGALRYWIGKPYWNNGYCTEASRAVIEYGFETLGLNRIHARHFTRNPASGRVMQKIGMTHEGSLRQHTKKWGQLEGLEVYGILRSEYYGNG